MRVLVRVYRGGVMRYNEKELQALSRQPAEMAAELSMRGPKKGSGERVGPRGSQVGGQVRCRTDAGLCPQWPRDGW